MYTISKAHISSFQITLVIENKFKNICVINNFVGQHHENGFCQTKQVWRVQEI